MFGGITGRSFLLYFLPSFTAEHHRANQSFYEKLGLHTSELSRVIYSAVSRDDQDDGGYINTSLSFPSK